MSGDAIADGILAALAQATREAVSRELDACEALLNERIGSASRDEHDHKGDPVEVRRELAGYARGLRDARFVLRERRKS